MGCHFLLQGNLPDLGIEPVSLASPALAGRFFTAEPPGKPHSSQREEHMQKQADGDYSGTFRNFEGFSLLQGKEY